MEAIIKVCELGEGQIGRVSGFYFILLFVGVVGKNASSSSVMNFYQLVLPSANLIG